MKYMNKTQMGLEHYFSSVSPVFTLLSEFSAEDTLGLLVERSTREQNEFCGNLFDALEVLIKSNFAHKDLIPDNVRRIAESLIAPDAYSIERILPVLTWLEKLHIKNEQNRVQWISSLRGFAAEADQATAAFMENFPLMESQRVSVIREGDNLRVSLPEKQWGQVGLTFPNAQVDGMTEFPVFGYLFVFEASFAEQRGQIQFLLDLDFSETPYQERLLSDEHWMEISFSCDVPVLQTALFDYTRRALSYGWGHAQTLEMCCEALASKQDVLGKIALTTEEHRLLLISQLFCSAMHLNGQGKGEPFEWNASPLANRYGLEAAADFLEKQNEIGNRLSQLLRMALDAFEVGNNKLTLRTLTAFAREFDSLEKSVDGCAFAANMAAHFAQASASYTDNYSEQNAHNTVLKTLSDYLSETLTHLGFSGELPHYSRQYARTVHFLSFVLQTDTRINERGFLEIPYSLSVARVPIRTFANRMGAEKRNPAAFFAEDFRHIGRAADFTRLATEDDAGRAVFEVDFHDPTAVVAQAEQLSKKLEYHLLIADSALKNLPIDKAYRVTLRKMLGRRRAFRRMAVPLLLSSITSVGALAYWMVDNVFDINHTKLTVTGFAALAVVAAVTGLLVTYWKHIRSIWAQRNS